MGYVHLVGEDPHWTAVPSKEIKKKKEECMHKVKFCGAFALCLYLLGSPNNLTPVQLKKALCCQQIQKYLDLQEKCSNFCPISTKFELHRQIYVNP